jgi:hypothetical protein
LEVLIMKKKMTAALLAIALCAACAPALSLGAVPLDGVAVIVDGQSVHFPDAPAYVDTNGRVQLPARYIGEALGAHVLWDEAENEISVRRTSSIWREYGAEIVFHIGSAEYRSRMGSQSPFQRFRMDTEAAIEQSRAYIPVRYIAEALGAEVDWDAQTRTVAITSKTMDIGAFVIPQSYTNSATYMSVSQYTHFQVAVGPTSYSAGIDVRTEAVLHVLSQRLGQGTIEKLRGFMVEHLDFRPGDGFDFYDRNAFLPGNPITAYGRAFFDELSGQYVLVIRDDRYHTFHLNVYDKGVPPHPGR